MSQSKKSRLTVDMTSVEHACLKIACAKLHMSMKDFLLFSAFERIEEFEDEWLAQQARKILEDIKSGKEKTISWEEMKKRIA